MGLTFSKYFEKDTSIDNIERNSITTSSSQTESLDELLIKNRRAVLAAPWDYFQKLDNGLTLRGHSRSGERTCFYIAELSTYLDAGLQGLGEPLMVLLTHGHCDHSHALPMMNIGLNIKTNVLVPKEIAKHASDYIMAMYKLNKSSYIPCNLDNRYPFTAVESNQKYKKTIKKKNYVIETFKCYHSVPSIGYGITELRKKLKPEYETLEGKEIGQLRKTGVEVTFQKEIPLIAYMGDTTIKALEDEKNESVFNYPYIMIETTFFLPDQVELAIKNTHTHWQHLIPYVLKYPNIKFILIHFSPRYRDQEIIDFFEIEKEKYKINNIIVWIN